MLTVLSPAQRGCTTVTRLAAWARWLTSAADLPDTQLVNPIIGTSDYPNNQVPINPIIATYISKYLPLPNIPGTNNFAANPIGRIQEDQGIIRIDHHSPTATPSTETGSSTMSGTHIRSGSSMALPAAETCPIGSGFSDATRSQQGAVTWTHIFSPQVINEFIFGSNRVATLMAIPADTTSPADLGFTNVNPDDTKGVAPPILFSNTFQLGPSPQGPTKEHDVTFHWQDSVSWNKGHHDLKFGADIRRIRNNFNFDFFNNGSFDFANFVSPFTGDGFADFVGGFPDNYFQFSNAVYGIRTYSLHFYGQDSWKVLPRLTLDLGCALRIQLSPEGSPQQHHWVLSRASSPRSSPMRRPACSIPAIRECRIPAWSFPTRTTLRRALVSPGTCWGMPSWSCAEGSESSMTSKTALSTCSSVDSRPSETCRT